MIVIRSMDDPRFAGVPSPHRPAVERAVRILCPIRVPDPHQVDQGFVVFIEPTDDPECISRTVDKDISIALEGAFHDGSCLIGVVLYGNSGSERRGSDAGKSMKRLTWWMNPPGDAKNKKALACKREGLFVFYGFSDRGFGSAPKKGDSRFSCYHYHL